MREKLKAVLLQYALHLIDVEQAVDEILKLQRGDEKTIPKPKSQPSVGEGR